MPKPQLAEAFVEYSFVHWQNNSGEDRWIIIFVPQFYLRGFCDSSAPAGHEPWIWVADFKDEHIERRAPKNVAKAANYYEFPGVEDAGGDPPESVLSKIESVSAPAVKRIISSENSALQGQDRADLLFFIAAFVIRVPFFRHLVENFATKFMKTLMQASAGNPEYFARSVREALKGKQELKTDEVEDLRQWVLDSSKYRIRTSPTLSMVMGFEMVLDTFYPIFEQMKWAVVRADAEFHFITGDTPVTWIDPTLPAPFCYGLQARHTEVTFPVGPKVSLFGTWEGPERSIPANEAMVHDFNMRRVVFAERYIYADSEAGARSALEMRASRKQKTATE